MTTLKALRRAVHDVRDRFTEDGSIEPILPLALDVLYNSPAALRALANHLDREIVLTIPEKP